MLVQYLKDLRHFGLAIPALQLPMGGHEGFSFGHVGKWMMLLYDVEKNGDFAGHPANPSKKFDDWSGIVCSLQRMVSRHHCMSLKMKS